VVFSQVGEVLVDHLGVPVVAAPAEIDITNADGLRSALLKAAADGRSMLVVDITQFLRFVRAARPDAISGRDARQPAAYDDVLLSAHGAAPAADHGGARRCSSW
jgi:hypothetical protein